MAFCCVGADWQKAQPGWRYEFPRDHRSHPEFKTEWWYFTGNLADAQGRRFGYQLTFFRQGILPPAARETGLSRFVVDDLKFAHFTITDVAGERFLFDQKTSRGAFGEAGFAEGERLAWIDSWNCRLDDKGVFHLQAERDGAALDLRLEPVKPPVIHGENGFSQKAATPDHASHYYSLTRLRSTGKIRIGGETFAVTGESWFDHEWATNQLAPGQVGWDWLSLQFNDGAELMLYQMRLENGGVDPGSSGSFIARDGSTIHLRSSQFRMAPIEFWTSKATSARYPIGWRVELPEQGMQITVRALLEDQELGLEPLVYWEGAVEATGSRDGAPIKGRGYLELTGYAGPLKELQR